MKPVIAPKPSLSDSYCLTLGRISVRSGPNWSILFCSQHEPEQSILAPGRSSRCSGHTSSALLLYTSAPLSSSPFALCRPQHRPRSCTKEKETNLKGRIPQRCVTRSLFYFPLALNLNLHFCLLGCYAVVLSIGYSTPLLLENSKMLRFYSILNLDKPKLPKMIILSSRSYMVYWTVNVALSGVSFPGVHSSTFLRFTEVKKALMGLGREEETEGNNTIIFIIIENNLTTQQCAMA